jgi:two-component system sensor histidine kinase HydH
MSSDFQKQKNEPPAANLPTDWTDHLRQLDRLANLGLVAAGLAHEIKNGLVAITTHVEMLTEKGEDREMAMVVRRELKRIDSLVTQILRAASPAPSTFATVRMHELLDHSLRLLEHQTSERKITVKREYHAVPDTLRGAESQLQQAVMNLLLNAIDAMGERGELTVATASINDGAGTRQLKMSIRDTGQGIAPENLARVFDTFFTTKKNGTGLGLAICRRVAEEHFGELAVHSEMGRGSTFSMILPAH